MKQPKASLVSGVGLIMALLFFAITLVSVGFLMVAGWVTKAMTRLAPTCAQIAMEQWIERIETKATGGYTRKNSSTYVR